MISGKYKLFTKACLTCELAWLKQSAVSFGQPQDFEHGFNVVRSSKNSLFSFRLWMSSSSVIKASHWFIAAERIKQSTKSLSMPLSLKAVSKIVLSCIGIVATVPS